MIHSLLLTITLQSQQTVYNRKLINMKTHMNNTQALKLHNDVVGHQHFLNHQRAIHSNVKPLVVTKRKEQIKIQKNRKVELNNDPKKHVNALYSNLYHKGYKSTIDNKNSAYLEQKQLLADKIKRNKYEQNAKKEHELEIMTMNQRISNCKSLEQRKKDKTDPIVNPAYFIKGAKDVGSVTINEYSKKVLGMNRPHTAALQRGSTTTFKGQNIQFQQQPTFKPPTTQLFGSMSHYARQRPQSANPKMGKGNKGKEEDLPGCTFKQILNHIVDNKLFKDVEMKVLYVRLCHQYGEQSVEEIWGDLMDELQR